MNNPNQPAKRPSNWADPVDRLNTRGVPEDAINLNVEGRRITSPMQGFGQLWRKRYWVRLCGVDVSPPEMIRIWKDNFGNFWPRGNYFYSSAGIEPGSVAVINLAGNVSDSEEPSGQQTTRISTGIVVMYSDENSFSFMTPEGHMFAGIITFSGFNVDGCTVAEISALLRASDPLYELGFRLGFSHKAEDRFWTQTLQNLAQHFQAQSNVEMEVTRLDEKMNWRNARNLWKNAAIRTSLYRMSAPLRWLARPFYRNRSS